MRINADNYEAFLLDYLEGRLDASEIRELRAFCLMQGFDWEEMTEDLPAMEPEAIVFDKRLLFQEEIVPLGDLNEDNFESRFVAYHEGLLDETEAFRVDAFVRQNPSLAADFRLFGMSKLQPNEDIVYERKESLLKSGKNMPWYVKAVSVAAAVALLLGLFNLPRSRQEKREPLYVLAELNPIEVGLICSEEALPSVLELRTAPMLGLSVGQEIEQPLPSERTEPLEVLASLEPKQAVCLRQYDDISMDPILQLPYSLVEGGFFLANQSEEYVYEDYEIDRSLVSQGIQYLSQGQYETLGEVIRTGLHKVTHAAVKHTAKVTMTAYYMADARLDLTRAKWEERFGRKGSDD